jgi:prepilin-type N-terminal cleavage/methylation domain-containing protein
MFSDNPHSELLQRAQRADKQSANASNRGFTLIELLVVIAIILVLAGITFGISRGVQNAQARARVKADLAAIAQGLEQFKSVYGDYPSTENATIDNNSYKLWMPLHGQLVWKVDEDGTVSGMTRRDSADGYVSGDNDGGRVFIDDESLSTEYDSDGIGEFQDPWGNPYYYDYRVFEGDWDNFGYILYSAGPDGAIDPVGTDGILTSDIRNSEDNADNIYLGE